MSCRYCPAHPEKERAFGCSCNGPQIDSYLRKRIKTNADLIRAMNDDALADWLMTEAPKLISAPIWCKGGCEDEENCTHERECVKNWLSQPAEEE